MTEFRISKFFSIMKGSSTVPSEVENCFAVLQYWSNGKKYSNMNTFINYKMQNRIVLG